MHITNISDAKSSLSSLISQVQQGKEVIIGKAGKPIAKLVPYEESQADRQLGGSWEGQVKMSDDFDQLPEGIMDAFAGNDRP